jgi:hypothetical protein
MEARDGPEPWLGAWACHHRQRDLAVRAQPPAETRGRLGRPGRRVPAQFPRGAVQGVGPVPAWGTDHAPFTFVRSPLSLGTEAGGTDFATGTALNQAPLGSPRPPLNQYAWEGNVVSRTTRWPWVCMVGRDELHQPPEPGDRRVEPRATTLSRPHPAGEHHDRGEPLVALDAATRVNAERRNPWADADSAGRSALKTGHPADHLRQLAKRGCPGRTAAFDCL